jgi:hypothetical protein
MKKINLLILVLLVLSTACKKKKKEETQVTDKNYGQLKVGNYWVYERFEIDTNGTATPMGVVDTCRIEKDTIINGKQYFKYVRPSFPGLDQNTYLRDSLHYIVDQTGRKVFSSEDFNKVFRTFITTDYELQEWMTDIDYNFTTPLGTFKTINFQMIYTMVPQLQFFGSQRYMSTRYAENIGIVSETLPLFYTSPIVRERRLIDFHLE